MVGLVAQRIRECCDALAPGWCRGAGDFATAGPQHAFAFDRSKEPAFKQRCTRR